MNQCDKSKTAPRHWARSRFQVSFFYKFNYIFDPTVEDIAQCVKGPCTDCFAVLYSVYSVCAQPLPVDQIVLGDVLFKKCTVKWPIAYQNMCTSDNRFFYFIIVYLLTMLNILTIIFTGRRIGYTQLAKKVQMCGAD